MSRGLRRSRALGEVRGVLASQLAPSRSRGAGQDKGPSVWGQAVGEWCQLHSGHREALGLSLLLLSLPPPFFPSRHLPPAMP